MWYVVQVETNQEKKTMNLCNQILKPEAFITCFLPKYENLIRYQGEWHKNTDLLFPGYLFVETETVDRLFLEFKQIPKLTKILGTGNYFSPISSTEEQFLKQLSNQNHIIPISIGYIKGQHIVIQEGPLINYEGRIKKIDRHKRIAFIEVQMFGRLTEVKVGLEVIHKS